MTFPLPDPHGTHLPLLVAAVIHSAGPVLELGCGNYSTPVLHNLCRSLGQNLWTYDGDRDWLEHFADLRSPRHSIEWIDRNHWETCPLEVIRWGCAFVDHAGPKNAAGERRIVEIERLRHIAQIIVVHDTEESGYGYEPVLSKFRYRFDYMRSRPWTSAVSMTMDVGSLFG